LSGPLTYREADGLPGSRIVQLRGTKTDSLGETGFPSGTDNYNIGLRSVIRILENDGYFTTSAGERYFLVDVFFSDRFNGDVYVETHAVFIDKNVPLGNQWFAYRNARNNGVQDLEGEGAPILDEARLFATVENGEWTFFRDGEPEEDAATDDHHHDHEMPGMEVPDETSDDGQTSGGEHDGHNGGTDTTGDTATEPADTPGTETPEAPADDGQTSGGQHDGHNGGTDTTGDTATEPADTPGTETPEAPADDDQTSGGQHDGHNGGTDTTGDTGGSTTIGDNGGGGAVPAPEPEPEPAAVVGRVMNRAGAGLSDAVVTFTPDGAAALQTRSDATGGFQLDLGESLPGQLQVSLAFGAGHPAPTMQSAQELLRMAVGLPPSWGAATAHDFIAADFNGDSQVTMADARHLLRAASGMNTPFGPRWVFVDEDADLSHIDRSNVTLPNGTRVEDFSMPAGGIDMVGILVGQLQEF
jgi:hypothetical protein